MQEILDEFPVLFPCVRQAYVEHNGDGPRIASALENGIGLLHESLRASAREQAMQVFFAICRAQLSIEDDPELPLERAS